VPKLSDKFKWSKSKFFATKPIFPDANYSDCSKDAHVLFERFFDDEVLEMICEESNQYGVLISQKKSNISKDELRVFFGITVIAGYNTVPCKQSYWSRDSDLYNAMIANAMPRHRYLLIERCIHFSHKAQMDPKDKMWKMQTSQNKIL